jgi:hypothetical protein
MSFAWDMQVAIYSKLTETLAGIDDYAVYSHVPQDKPLPFVVIGETTELEFDTDDSEGFNSTVQIHTWSNERSNKQVKEMQSAVYKKLHRAELVISGYNVITVEVEQARNFVESDGITRHGVQQVRIFAQRG